MRYGRFCRAWGAALVVGTTTMMAPAAARAQEHDPLAAQGLYDDGRKLMAAKQYAEACPKFEESQRLDPGVGTHYALADCYEKSGRIATAWVAFLDVVSESQAQSRADRAKIAQQRADALQPRVSKINVVVSAAAKVPGLEVRRDGELLRAGQWGTAVPVDPGAHAIAATAPGKQPYQTSIDVRVEGKTFDVNIPPLREVGSALPQASTSSVQPLPSAPATTRAASPTAPGGPSSGLGTQRVLAIAAGVVGLAGVGLGTYFGLQSFSKHSDAQSDCVGSACNPAGLQLIHDGESAGNISTVAFIVGAVAVAGGVVLWLTAPHRTSTERVGLHLAPLVGAGTGGVMLGGGFQ